MTEIAQLFESALRQNRANLLRKAALNTVSRMPATMTLRELLQSEAGAAIRELTLRELSEALDGVAPPEGAQRRMIWPMRQPRRAMRAARSARTARSSRRSRRGR